MKKKYRNIPWNRYNLEKYRDINFGHTAQLYYFSYYTVCVWKGWMENAQFVLDKVLLIYFCIFSRKKTTLCLFLDTWSTFSVLNILI